MNFDANKEIARLNVKGLENEEVEYNEAEWKKIDYNSFESIGGRQNHSSVAYNDKVYTFGGCFMFNRKRQVRECTNQVLVYDTL